MTSAGMGRGWLTLAAAVWVCGCSGGGGGSGERAGAAGGPASGVRLLPDPAYASARIEAVLDDPRLDADDCRFEWRRNGDVIAGAESEALDPSEFARGDEIEVAVLAPDGPGGATRRLGATVRVRNTPPTLTRIFLGITNDSGGPAVASTVESVDPDGDAPGYEYRWFANGVPIVGEGAAALPVARVARGDQVVVEVVARDGEDESLPMRSEPFAFTNRPPEISSQPNAPRAADDRFQYQAEGSDPDGDALRFELVAGPDGMTVDAAGSVSWPLPTGSLRDGDFPVRIRATDSRGGEATQDFTIHLDPQVAAR